jgi:hypothetical protein
MGNLMEKIWKFNYSYGEVENLHTKGQVCEWKVAVESGEEGRWWRRCHCDDDGHGSTNVGNYVGCRRFNFARGRPRIGVERNTYSSRGPWFTGWHAHEMAKPTKHGRTANMVVIYMPIHEIIYTTRIFFIIF